ncbi:MAG: polymer-forming cytoskeletal protein [Maricaulis sp.]|jgi:cytoskeletal protein CcmA (bactofilin family)|nr:polymer-forming cytoskeletal protein [Maricaulis sp.]MBO6848514.1 polymer-forming cytoskeletal protein [Maricaulis sp.]MBO6878098.1 polymer-forming cytoskeletal protein [Maricaulis sp.]
MFNKSNKDTSNPDPMQQPAAAPKRNAMKSKAPSILSGDLVLTGSIVSEGEVQLDGTVDGDIRAGSLIIGEEANVNGEVMAETVVIRGRVSGSVHARQVQLASTARIEGDIVHAALSVESGAFFDGHCRHASDPLSEKSSGGAPASAPKAANKSDDMPPAPGKSSVTSLDPPLASKSSA